MDYLGGLVNVFEQDRVAPRSARLIELRDVKTQKIIDRTLYIVCEALKYDV